MQSSASLAPATRLRAAAAILAEHDPGLAEGLATMAASGVGLAEALGWASDWHSAGQRRARDELIKKTAAGMKGSVHARARQLEAMLRRGRPEEILRLNNGQRLGWRQISRLLE